MIIDGADDGEDLGQGRDLDTIISGAMTDAGLEGLTPPADAEPATDTPPDGRARDASGRFSPAATASAPAEPAVAVADPAAATAKPPVATATLDAPARWSDADKAAFTAMPQDAQRMLLDRHNAMEADYTRKSQEIAAFRQSAEPLVSAIQPHAEYLQQLGLRPDQAVGQLLMTERSLRLGSPEQKLAALAGLAGQYGIDVRALVAGGRPDPVLSQLHQQGQSVDQRLRAIETARQAEVQRAAEAEHASAVSNVTAFQAATNADGSLKYPHFEAVRGTMQNLFAQGRATSLEDAYATAAAPITAAVEAERAKFEAARGQQRQAQVARAQRAAPALAGGTTPGQSKPSGLDAIIAASLASAGIA